MKTTISALLLAFTLPSFALAQSPTRQSQGPKNSQVGVRPQARAVKAAPSELDRNIAISATGQFSDGSPIDIMLTGCGREFVAQVVMGKTEIGGKMVPNIGSVRFNVNQKEGAYMVSYSIGARIAIPTSSVRPAPGAGPATVNTSIGFEEVLIEGLVRSQPATPVQVFKSGDQALVLTVTEP